MSNSQVSRFLKNAFGRKEQAYVPIPTSGINERSSQETSEEDTIQQVPPEDNYRVVYLIFLLQGVAMLLGWNVFINASVFFQQSFLGSGFADNFQNYFSIVYMSSNLFFLGLALLTHKSENISFRITFAISLMISIFVLIAISTHYIEFFGPTIYFYFVVTSIGIMGATAALQQNEIFALVSQFSPIYTQSVMSGQGFAGSAIAVSQILSALMIPPSSNLDENDLRRSALLYFICATIISLVTLISYFILIRLPLYLHYIQVRMIQNAESVENTYDQKLLKETFNKIRILAFTVGFVFFVTLSLFPSITTSIKSVVDEENKSKFRQDYLFIPLHFLIFNIGDWLGRSLPSLQSFVTTDSVKLALMSIARIIFFPIFLMCNVDVGSYGTRTWPLMINSDLIYFLTLWLFAVSNGYMGSLTMMAAPQVEGVNKGLAGTIMSFCLVLGLAIGSVFSFPMRAISCSCNPIGNI
ncbi:13229_t:CDS:2 [Funneliformis mosseae]|uniref:13229_t:CDS:1 n=1 Tax=Funneliformis mosseae TaxID=27381 RepID=A0A9N9GJT0_FUNMO|nr:13229_t:CDS:2 [Funneliformis mosseae]